jgi:uncharacterized membrane protein YfcA
MLLSGLPPHLIALALAAALLAGWVDAVVGGGGLIQLPVLILLPGLTPLQAIATNKLSGTIGITVSAGTFLHRVRPPAAVTLTMLTCAVGGAVAGASLAARLPAGVLLPIVFVAVVAVGAYTLLRPRLGEASQPRFSPRVRLVLAAVLAIGMGVYDGLAGPGTGTFLTIGVVTLLGSSFVEGSAIARVVNWGTNAAALTVFIAHGAPLYALGLAMGALNAAGGYLGARMAVARGARFIRVVFLAVVLVLAVRLGWQVFDHA